MAGLSSNPSGREEKMELESVRKYLEKGDGEETASASTVDHGFPPKFLEPLILHGLCLDLIEPGRVVFSMNIPPRLLDSSNSLHRGAIVTLVDVVGAAAFPSVGYPINSGLSLEINVTCLDAVYVNEEIEIDSRVLRVGKAVAVVSVDFRKKKTGKIFAQGRHTKYLAFASKM